MSQTVVQAEVENGSTKALVGVVVIGRNEGPRLERCLRAAREQCDRVIYVDSNSTDESVATAERCGATVIRLTAGPFTAARGRQIGFESLLHNGDALEYVQFIDGDCILEAGWLERATRHLDEENHLGAIVGLRVEEHPEATLFNRLVDLDWRMPIGETDSLGSGDALLRVAALQEVGGWNVSLIAGEDPELSFRLVDAGWRIKRLDMTMTTHDVRMSSWRQFWRRAVRAGHAYAEVGLMRRDGAGRRWLRRIGNIIVHGGVIPALILLGWILSFWVSVLAAAIWGVTIIRMTRWRIKLGDPNGFAIIYALATSACKIANFLGVMQYFVGRMRRKPATLIEYQSSDQGERSVSEATT